MIDEGEAGNVSRQSFTGGQFGSRSIDAQVILGAGAIGALLGGAMVWLLRTFRAGDEPPIRVKGGSVHLDVLSSTAVWKQQGPSGKKWMLHASGPRGKEEYDVSIIASSPNCAEKSPSGRLVRIEFTEGKVIRWVELQAPGKRTKVTDASDPLTLTNADRRLSLSGSGYISKIIVDGSVCEFSSADELDYALLSDF